MCRLNAEKGTQCEEGLRRMGEMRWLGYGARMCERNCPV